MRSWWGRRAKSGRAAEEGEDECLQEAWVAKGASVKAPESRKADVHVPEIVVDFFQADLPTIEGVARVEHHRVPAVVLRQVNFATPARIATTVMQGARGVGHGVA